MAGGTARGSSSRSWIAAQRMACRGAGWAPRGAREGARRRAPGAHGAHTCRAYARRCGGRASGATPSCASSSSASRLLSSVSWERLERRPGRGRAFGGAADLRRRRRRRQCLQAGNGQLGSPRKLVMMCLARRRRSSVCKPFRRPLGPGPEIPAHPARTFAPWADWQCTGRTSAGAGRPARALSKKGPPLFCSAWSPSDHGPPTCEPAPYQPRAEPCAAIGHRRRRRQRGDGACGRGAGVRPGVTRSACHRSGPSARHVLQVTNVMGVGACKRRWPCCPCSWGC